MKHRIAAALLALVGSAGLMIAQLTPKSKAEYDAVLAVQNAATPDERIKAADSLLTKYADTQFKSWALEAAAGAAQQKGDTDTMIIYSERSLEANPKSYNAMFMLSQAWAARTKEFDLDKEEKLTRAEKYAKDGLDLVKDAPKPNPAVPDAQWEAARKDFASQGHESLGMAAMVRKKWDLAVTEYKTAIDVASTPDPATYVRLAGAYAADNKYDAAIATLDKVLAIPDVHPQVKQIATQQKAQFTAAKTKQSAAPKPAATPETPQVEIKK